MVCALSVLFNLLVFAPPAGPWIYWSVLSPVSLLLCAPPAGPWIYFSVLSPFSLIYSSVLSPFSLIYWSGPGFEFTGLVCLHSL